MPAFTPIPASPIKGEGERALNFYDNQDALVLRLRISTVAAGGAEKGGFVIQGQRLHRFPQEKPAGFDPLLQVLGDLPGPHHAGQGHGGHFFALQG